MRDPVSGYLRNAFAPALGSPFTVLTRAVVSLFTAPFAASAERLLLFLTGLVDWVYDTTLRTKSQEVFAVLFHCFFETGKKALAHTAFV